MCIRDRDIADQLPAGSAVHEGGFIQFLRNVHQITQHDQRDDEDVYKRQGYGNDNPGAKSQGMKQLMAGGGIALVGATLIPLLSGLFG